METLTTLLTLSSKSSQGTSRTVIGVVGVAGCATTRSLRGLFGVPFLGFSGTSGAGQCRFVGAVKDKKYACCNRASVRGIFAAQRAHTIGCMSKNSCGRQRTSRSWRAITAACVINSCKVAIGVFRNSVEHAFCATLYASCLFFPVHLSWKRK